MTNLRLEIVQIKAFAGLELVRHFFGFIEIDIGLRFFDQRQNVAHAEDAAGHAFRVKHLEAGQLLAGAGELDRRAGDMPHRQRRAAARIAIELGQNHAGERQRVVKRLGGIDGILAEHGIGHKQCFNRTDGSVQGGDLLHHRFIDPEPAGRVNDQHIVIVVLAPLHRSAGNVERVLIRRRREKVGTRLGGHRFELLNRGGAVNVDRHQQHFFLLLFLEPACQFARRGGFASALQPGQQNDGGWGGSQVESRRRAAHDGSEFAVDQTDQRLAGRERSDDLLALGFFLDAGYKVAHHRQRHVGFEQRQPHFAQHLGGVGLGQTRFAAQGFDHLGEAVGKVVQHGVGALGAGWLRVVRKGF